jgi:hypothetical protein
MGDRGNIVLHYGTHKTRDGEREYDPVYLYTHWHGSELPAILARALDRGRERWDDPSYLARIIFSEMVGSDEQDAWPGIAAPGTTGFGISPWAPDNEHPLLHVFLEQQLVEMSYDDRAMPTEPSVGYDEFIAQVMATEW